MVGEKTNNDDAFTEGTTENIEDVAEGNTTKKKCQSKLNVSLNLALIAVVIHCFKVAFFSFSSKCIDSQSVFTKCF